MQLPLQSERKRRRRRNAKVARQRGERRGGTGEGDKGGGEVRGAKSYLKECGQLGEDRRCDAARGRGCGVAARAPVLIDAAGLLDTIQE